MNDQYMSSQQVRDKVACEKCGVSKGEKCVDLDGSVHGKTTPQNHVIRVRAALRQKAMK